ncbi:MAG: hypothetical protein ACRYHQ_11720 [Janthinobacterium lividum]
MSIMEMPQSALSARIRVPAVHSDALLARWRLCAAAVRCASVLKSIAGEAR